jgi:hypothetical protein
MFSRILGTLTFRRAKYLEIAKDRTATGQAIILVVISAVLFSLIEVIVFAGEWAGAGRANIVRAIGWGTVSFVSSFASWILTAVLLVLIVGLFKGKTTVGEMLRVTGFVEIFAILAYVCALVVAISGLVSAGEVVFFVIAFLALGGYIVGVSETTGITVGKALTTAFIADIAGFFVTVFITDLILGVLKMPAP